MKDKRGSWNRRFLLYCTVSSFSFWRQPAVNNRLHLQRMQLNLLWLSNGGISRCETTVCRYDGGVKACQTHQVDSLQFYYFGRVLIVFRMYRLAIHM